MSSLLREGLGVSLAGGTWDVEGYRLWQSTDPGTILFSPERARLATNQDGRYQASLSVLREELPDGKIKVTSGTLNFAITTGIQSSPEDFDKLKDAFRQATGNANAKFVPLNVRKGRAQVLIDPKLGTPHQAHNDQDIGTPGGMLSFQLALSEHGALQCKEAIEAKRQFTVPVLIDMEYLTLIPPVGAEVKLHGRRIFKHLSTALEVSVDGWFYGGSTKIEAAWEDMRRNGDIEINFIGNPPDEIKAMRDKLIEAFLVEARKLFWEVLFAPKPDIPPAEAGDARGFISANFALKWRKETDAVDLQQTIRFEGWTWLQTRMTADTSPMFAQMDESYLVSADPQQSVVATVLVDAEENVETVAVSWRASEGIAPQAPIFGKEGGNVTYVLSTQDPSNVVYKWVAKANFVDSDWPIIQHDGSMVGDDGTAISIKPSSWIERHNFYLYVIDSDGSLYTNPADHLIINVNCSGKHLRSTLTDSGKLISGGNYLQMEYPMDPEGHPAQALFSAFGVIDGKLVAQTDMQPVPEKEAILVVYDISTGRVELR